MKPVCPLCGEAHHLSQCPRWKVDPKRGGFISLQAGAAVAAVALAFVAGWQVNGWRINSATTAAALEQSEANREAERIVARSRTKQLDTFAQRLQAEQGVAAAAARDAERLRLEADRVAAAARANPAESDGATVARLAELLGEGAGLLEEGRRHLAECGAAREALSLAPSEGRMDR